MYRHNRLARILFDSFSIYKAPPPPAVSRAVPHSITPSKISLFSRQRCLFLFFVSSCLSIYVLPLLHVYFYTFSLLYIFIHYLSTTSPALYHSVILALLAQSLVDFCPPLFHGFCHRQCVILARAYTAGTRFLVFFTFLVSSSPTALAALPLYLYIITIIFYKLGHSKDVNYHYLY